MGRFFFKKLFWKTFEIFFFGDQIENFGRAHTQNAFRVLPYALTGIVGEVGDWKLAQAVASVDGRVTPGFCEEGRHRNGKFFQTIEGYFNIFNAVEINIPLMAVPASIQPLVERYTYHREAYFRGQEKSNESQLRQDFTDPLIETLQDASLDREKELLVRQVETTDASIDKLVNELYGLTEEEIAVVEGGGK